MAENERVKSKREAQIARLQERYPEMDVTDEEAIFGAIYDDYDKYDQELEGYKGREKTLSDMFAADPRSAQFLTDMHRGEDPIVGLVRNFGPEIKDLLDDPEMQEKLAEANKEYVERVAKSKELKEAYDTNFSESMAALEAFQQEKGLSDEEVDSLGERIVAIVQDAIVGKFPRELYDMIWKAMSYDADVAAAAEEGEIAGRNTKITEQLRKPEQGDGTRPLGGTNNGPGRAGGKKSLFDWAREAN